MVKWEKLVARNMYVLNWTALVMQGLEWINIGPARIKQEHRLIIKYDSPLSVTFTTEPYATTNILSLIEKINPEIDKGFEEAEQRIHDALQLQPGTTKEELKKLYIEHKWQLGIMCAGHWISLQIMKKLGADHDKETFEKIKKFQPYKKTTVAREHDAIQKIAQQELNEEELRKKAEELANTYGFIHSEYKGRSWTVKDYLEQFKDNVDITEEEHQVKLNPYYQWLYDLARKMFFLYDEGKAGVVRTAWAMRKTVENLGAPEEVFHCFENEFYKWIKTGNLPDTSNRDKYFALFAEDGKLQELDDPQEIKKLIEQEGITEFDEPEETNFVKGQVAQPGKVQGKVVIAFSHEDAERIQQGDILISSMTTPELIAGMRKAAAFVTDEGGITCHAAIVAREMQKPCIVGTQIATKVFKNGDYIEVDANDGIVRKTK